MSKGKKIEQYGKAEILTEMMYHIPLLIGTFR